jgi:hypothetical protein
MQYKVLNHTLIKNVFLPNEDAVYSYPTLLISDTVDTPITPDNMRIDRVRITTIKASLASGCLKRLCEAI